ncbi:hypothetical protein ACJX0J_025551, partial [Zea mays]
MTAVIMILSEANLEEKSKKMDMDVHQGKISISENCLPITLGEEHSSTVIQDKKGFFFHLDTVYTCNQFGIKEMRGPAGLMACLVAWGLEIILIVVSNGLSFFLTIFIQKKKLKTARLKLSSNTIDIIYYLHLNYGVSLKRRHPDH